jgi:hypothetical protein
MCWGWGVCSGCSGCSGWAASVATGECCPDLDDVLSGSQALAGTFQILTNAGYSGL